MNSFFTILGDAVKLLRARSLFWITLGISALVALLFLSIGFDSQGMSVLFGAVDIKNELLVKGSPGADALYNVILTRVLISAWLTFATLILGLIACGPIFPEFMLEGSAGVTLSKPVSRLTLFFSKFAGGLLFVLFQTLLFTVIVFIAIRWRIGIWNFSVFWTVPIVLLSFSYLFSVQTLIGIRSRSAMLSILGAIGMWFVSWLVTGGEAALYGLSKNSDPRSAMTEEVDSAGPWDKWHRAISMTHAVVPKVPLTSDLMNHLVVMKNGKSASVTNAMIALTNGRPAQQEEEEMRAAEVMRFTPTYIIGTSLIFEVVILAWAAWLFNRRDF